MVLRYHPPSSESPQFLYFPPNRVMFTGLADKSLLSNTVLSLSLLLESTVAKQGVLLLEI